MCFDFVWTWKYCCYECQGGWGCCCEVTLGVEYYMEYWCYLACGSDKDGCVTNLASYWARDSPTWCSILNNRTGIFGLMSPTRQVYRPNIVLLNSCAQPLMLKKAIVLGLRLQRSKLEACSFLIQTSFDKVSGMIHYCPWRCNMIMSHMAQRWKFCQ